MRWMRLRGLVVLVSVGLLVTQPVGVAAQNSRFFPETNRTVENAFLDFWNARGGVEIFGLPLSPVYANRDDRLQQIFERAILEWHPENDQPNRVQLLQLGLRYLGVLTYRDEQGQTQRSEPLLRGEAPRACANGTICETFAATRHTVRGPFLTFWRERGGLEVFGYPLTEEFNLNNTQSGRYAVQFFERMLLEYHPEINGGTILIARLGASTWESVKDGFSEADNGAFRVPPYTSIAPYLTGR